jgi:hypothetical protein
MVNSTPGWTVLICPDNFLGSRFRIRKQEPLQTLWGVIQAYTGAARSPELAVDVAYRLERVGAQLLAMVKSN